MKSLNVFVIIGIIALLAIGLGVLQASATPSSELLSAALRAPAADVSLSMGKPYGPDHAAQTFKMDVNISSPPGANLGAFEFDAIHTGSVVTATDVTTATFLTSTGREGIKLGPLPLTNGIAFGEATCGVQGQPGCSNPAVTPIPGAPLVPIDGPDGSGTLATLTLKRLGEGTTSLALENYQVTDIHAVLQTVTGATGRDIGVYAYNVVTSTSKNPFNMIAISVDMSGVITKAKDLADWFGPSAIGVAPWDSAGSKPGFGWLRQFPTVNNFDLNRSGSGVYLVAFNSSAPQTVLLAGDRPTPGSLTFSLFVPSSGNCKFSLVAVPWWKTSIIKAKDLADAISPTHAVGVAPWDASGSKPGFGWLRQFPAVNNFNVVSGHPYLVCINPGGPSSWTPDANP